jgi:phosphoglycerate kinase
MGCMNKLTLKDLSLKGKKVLMRVDFNVPLNKDGTVADDTRIRESLPSIQYVLDQGGSVILMSHLGRPKGKESQFSLRPCAQKLEELLKRPVQFAPDCIGTEAENQARHLKNGEVLLLENLRFYPAEEKPESDPSFAKKLAQLGDVYVNDAFGTAHRAHSSTAIIAQYFPHLSAMGFLIEKEVTALTELLLHPKRPFYAIIGGAKVSSKIGVLQALLDQVDGLFIGGGMAFTFLKAQGVDVGDSIHEDDQLATAKKLLDACHAKKVPLWLPEDVVIADAFTNEANRKTIRIAEGIPNGWQGMDVGPKTLESWKLALQSAATVFWNGPIGVFEFSHFAHGTETLAKTLARLHAVTVVGGGDSVAAINQLGLASQFTHVSTGGGASLEFLEQGHLPGIDALSN